MDLLGYKHFDVLLVVMVQKTKEETLHKFSTSLQHQEPMDMAWLL